jgi:YD repeat-containing protein
MAACARPAAELPPNDSGASPAATAATAGAVYIVSADAERIAEQYAREHWAPPRRTTATHDPGGWRVELEFDRGGRAIVVIDEKGRVLSGSMI